MSGGVLEHHGGQAPHTLFTPLHYEPGYAYPLLVWLHGEGADERQLMRIMPAVSLRNYVAVAPQGSQPLGAGRYDWGHSEEQLQAAEQRIFDCLHLAQGKLHVATRRIFLAGFDSGGSMAFRIAMAHPAMFAGVLSLGGAFPSGQRSLCNLAEARKLGLFLAAGRDSTRYPAARVCEDLRLFHTAGLSITLRQYPCGHVLSSQMLADVDRWIIEQITRPAACAPTEEANQPHPAD